MSDESHDRGVALGKSVLVGPAGGRTRHEDQRRYSEEH
jgi:hypothetical protein